MALGVLNTSISTTVTRIATHDNVGGLMGVLDTAEKLAGVVGPTVGGALYAYHTFAPVVTVIAGYVLMGVVVFVTFPRFVLPAMDKDEKKKEDDKPKTE
mmetsp:Transcript_21767/g.51689  ORF Transcript_21767/g.51689 Transcript_21767/m.51689 type:complete len:99 (-) Transcript_21767:591-887(-)